jgi:hypothetical protein
MKITKAQLKQIIKEELAQTLNELEDDDITKLATDAAGNASKKAVTKGIRGTGVRGIGGSLGALGAAASLVDLANPEGFYSQAGDATKGAYQDISKRAKEYFNPKKADKKKAANPAATRSTSTVSAPEQPMAEQLKQFIREELEVTLTNEEATEMFGEAVGTQLEEQELNEIDMSQAQPIIDAFSQVLAAIPYAVSPALIAYAFKQAVDVEKEERAAMGDQRPLLNRGKKEEK